MASASTKTRPIRVVKGSNFEPKRVRKARRKALIRGMVGNAVADVRNEFADRAEFYRNLRMIKLRRRHVAREMHALADMVKGLLGEVQRVENRHPELAGGAAFEEARELAKVAYASVSTAADEFALFARNRVYYVKEL
jgi:hypothetical protein